MIKLELDENYLSFDSSHCFLCLQSAPINVSDEQIKLNLFFKYLKIKSEMEADVCEECEEKLIKFVKLWETLEKIRLEMDYLLDSIKSTILDSNHIKITSACSRYASAREIVVEKCLEETENRKPQIILDRVDLKVEESPSPVSGPSLDDEDIADSLSNSGPVEPSLEDAAPIDNVPKKQLTPKAKLKCPKCPKMFKNEQKLKFHNDYFHLRLKRFKCPSCPKTFRINAEMRNHNNTVHLRLRPFQCDLCGKFFAKLKSLKKHKLTQPHDLKPDSFTCEFCGDIFKTNNYLRRHQRFVHREKKYECEICKQRFFERWKLKEHISVVHEEQRYSCQAPGCDRSYTQLGKLTKHYKLKHPDFIIPKRTKKQRLLIVL